MTIANQNPAPVADQGPQRPNAHLTDYIIYYNSLKEPGFAVLVTGEWGTGKTHLMKELLPWEGDGKASYYVSFFGLKTTDEVDAALYADMYPSLSVAEQGVKRVGEAARGISGFGFSPGGLISGAANFISAQMRKEIDTSKPIIFDDLERSSMLTNEELGVINYYVEHKHCRVIVIAHDEKLVDAMKEAKEKIFGQTIRIEPDAKSAFKKFRIELVKDGELVDPFENVILEVFAKSKTPSLRILRHVIFDLARFLATLEKRHIENEDAMRDIVPLFIAFAIATRRDAHNAESIISDRQGALARRMMRNISERRGAEDNKRSKFDDIQTIYEEINLENKVLNDAVLIDMLVRGRYNEEQICASLDRSSYFTKQEEMPSWRKLLEFDKLPRSIVEEAVRVMEEQFTERSVVQVGEMLHIFALRMMMAKRGMLPRTVEEVAQESEIYISDILAQGRLSPLTEKIDEIILDKSSHGYKYWIEDYEQRFHELTTYLREKLEVARERTYPTIGDELLTMLQHEPRKFAGAISYIVDGSHQHASLPVMTFIPVRNFIEVWQKARDGGEAWKWTRIGLEQRYESNALSGRLTSEAEWVRSVIVRIPTKPATHSNRKPATDSDLKPAGIPI